MPNAVFIHVSWAGLAAILACGCAPGVKLEDIQASAAGAIQNLPAQAQALIPNPIKPPKGSATDIYARIARGAHKCWMGLEGPLKGTHLFQAEAKPRSEGGAAQVDIHERIADKPNIPGRRVFLVTITPVAESASVYAENAGLPNPLAAAMKADVDAWAADEDSCAAQEPLIDAAPAEVPPEPSGPQADRAVVEARTDPTQAGTRPGERDGQPAR